MAEPITIARPYAKAVFDLAAEHNDFERWSVLLSQLVQIISVPALIAIIDDPKRSKSEIQKLVISLLPEQSDDKCQNLLTILQEYGRLSLVPEIVRQFELMKTEAQGGINAVIEAAYPLNSKEQDNLSALLSRKYKKSVKISIQKKPELVGGIRILVGDEVIDNSIRGKLHAMAVSLKN